MIPQISHIKRVRVKLLMIVSLLGLGILTTVPFLISSISDKSALTAKLLTIKQATDDIIYYDEVLTMSARMYTYTQQPSWLERYNSNADKLDGSLATAESLDQGIKLAIKATSTVNNQLIDIERNAFELVKSGNHQLASETLLSSTYHDLKAGYQANVNLALSNAMTSIEKQLATQENRRINILIGVFVVFSIAFVVVWLYLFRFFKHTDSALSDLMDSLNSKIEQLNKSTEELTLSNNAKNLFLANMSHELRTPLNGIYGNLQLLKKMAFPDKASEMLSTAASSCEMLNLIVNDILDFSKIEAGKLELESINFDLSVLIDDVGSIFCHSFKKKDINFTITKNIVHQHWNGDPLRIKQILVNIINNALKFTHQGQANLNVEVHNKLEGIRIELLDTGIGMDNAQLKKLFKKFEQADASTTRKYGGTGLGMPIVKSLIEIMHGDIKVTSKKDLGTQIYINLPLEPASENIAIDEAQAIESINLQGTHILVAEDNKINQVIAKNMLESIGCKVTIAKHGLQAIEKVNDDIDLVLMDIQMPKMDGITACIEVKKLMPNLPIIALTANVLPADIEQYDKTGFNDVIGKPINLEELNKILCKYLIKAK